MLIHFGGALAGAEEESVLVPVREHREAATARGLAPTEQGKASPVASPAGGFPAGAWALEPPN